MLLVLLALPLIGSERVAAAPRPAPTLTSDWRIEGDQAGAHLGSSLATCDVNGDGYGDLVVGAPGFDDIFRDEGRVNVYLGSSGGLSSVPDWTRYGRQRGARFGTRVAAAGDVNADGYDDVLISAPDFDRLFPPAKVSYVGDLDAHERYTSDEGRVQVFLGGPAGLSALPQRTLNGIERGEHFGSAIAGAGDVNGDGFDDVLIGATGKAGGLGALFLFAGKASGIGATPGWIEYGSQPGSDWGAVLGAGGDANSDGFGDFVASAPSFVGSGTCGQLWLYLGSATGPGSGQLELERRVPELGPSLDWNQDGLVDTLYLQTSCTNPGANAHWISFEMGLTGSINTSTLGVASVTAGDWNGDGWMDLAVGDSDFASGPFQGRVFQRMHEPGTQNTTSLIFPYFDGDQAGAGFGEELAAADVDGDGADELFIAAPRQEAGESEEGLVLLVPGWPDRWSLDETSYSSIPVGLQATPPMGSGDFDGDGFSDLVTCSDSFLVFEVRHGSKLGLPAGADYSLNLPPLGSIGCEVMRGFISAGDVTGDGFDDALITIDEGTNNCHGGYLLLGTRRALYLGSPSGLDPDPLQWFSDGGEIFTRTEIVGDVTGDGFEDALQVRGLDTRLFLGSSSGLPALPDQAIPGVPVDFGSLRARDMIPGDLDGDALRDIVMFRDGELLSFHGDPSGLVLQHTQSYPSPFLYPLALADIDADGIDDLLLEQNGQTQTWLGSPAGFVESPQWWGAPIPHTLLAVFDADGDGFDELLFAGERIQRGSATGVERIPVWWGAAEVQTQRLPEAADFDGDGRLELAFAPSIFGPYVLQIFEVSGL